MGILWVFEHFAGKRRAVRMGLEKNESCMAQCTIIQFTVSPVDDRWRNCINGSLFGKLY